MIVMNSKELFKNLKEKARDYPVSDLIKVKYYFDREMKIVLKKYRENFVYSYFGLFYETLMEIKNKSESEIPTFDLDEVEIQKLNERIDFVSLELKTEKGREEIITLEKIVYPYLVFISKKPLHHLSLRFPGGNTIIEKKGIYFCPIRDAQENDLGICEFCCCKDYTDLY
ncbi:conserved hypothetical protein [Methanococcus maripaludis C5]|uniref:UPF0305 protein MmarC5_1148 n=2 Tax=Methanococcus maripaludis TaxID=39152 RepID=A4FZ14_METM5|nr:conserved hypothetical protein [Methanococcus maripaludis C5]